ncbi:MAG: rod shape-determining protein MreD [Desulfobacterota bacterium]|nr:rod shape-determining protein MreD [Thermodesulfobacteriota bacterium]
MKRFFISVFLGLLLITLQASWLTLPHLRWVRPDMMLLLTLYVGLTFPLASGGILALFLGYLLDLYSGNTLGLFTVTRLFLFLGIQFFKRHLYLEHYPGRFVFVLLVCIFEGFLILLLLKAFLPEASTHFLRPFLTMFLPQCFSSALLAPFLFSLLGERGILFRSALLSRAGGGKG